MTREPFVDKLKSLGDSDIGLGCELTPNSNEHQANLMLLSTVIQDYKIVPIADEDPQWQRKVERR